MRIYVLISLLLLPCTAGAVEAPTGQTAINASNALRGQFAEEHQLSSAQAPVQSSGHFLVAPAHGLIWGIEQPFPTSTIITPDQAFQDVGGIALKLHAKNLRHLYEIVSKALAADWNGLDEDFVITRGGNADHWQMLLIPRQNDKPKLAYTTITISGHRYVENIVMTKADGTNDTLRFTNTVLLPVSLTAQEAALFSEAGQ